MKIVLLPGDGIGPEVVAAGRLVLEAVADRFGHRLEIEECAIGGAAIDATGDPLPAATVAACREADAILLGAVGGPRWDAPDARVRPEQGLLGIRRALGLFANLRPVRPHPSVASASPLRAHVVDGVDLLVVRELTGGMYFGAKTLVSEGDGERAIDTCEYTTGEIERIARVAGDLARSRRRRVTSVDKANVLETSRLWRRTTARVMAEEFPDVRVEHALVDSCAMRLIQRPREFDVILTENMFGDILTDEAAVLAGSIGVLPSASLGDARPGGGRRPGLYEPIHGSAPDLAGTGTANPIGTIASVAMMFRHSLQLEPEAAAIDTAIRRTLDAGIVTPDLAASRGDGVRGAVSTLEVARAVVARLSTTVARDASCAIASTA